MEELTLSQKKKEDEKKLTDSPKKMPLTKKLSDLAMKIFQKRKSSANK